jgi:hypothetical protein
MILLSPPRHPAERMALPPNPPSPPLHLPTQPRNLTQLRYDLRKLKAHALLARDGSRYAYQFTEKGIRVALMFILFHQRICGPLANTLFHRRPTQLHTPATQLQLAYQKADASIQQIIDLLAA